LSPKLEPLTSKGFFQLVSGLQKQCTGGFKIFLNVSGLNLSIMESLISTLLNRISDSLASADKS